VSRSPSPHAPVVRGPRSPLLLLLLAVAVPSPRVAGAQAVAPPPRGPSEVATVGRDGRSGRPVPPSLTPAGMLKAVARTSGTASPGLKVTLDGSASGGSRIWYRWLQTQGPTARIDDSTKSQAHFIVPTDAASLGFVLVVGDASGVDLTPISIEVEDPDRQSDDAALKADAGDDQAARVGRRVTLNGVRSEPKGKLRFRWIQTGGPKVALKATDGVTTSFVPAAPGSYQFALVVASAGGVLSDPAAVTITVTGTARAGAEGTDGPNMAIDELARTSLASIEGGTRYADGLSTAFDAVADRMETFRNFRDVHKELAGYLDTVVPREPARRSVWIEQFLSPLMAKVAAGMRTEGMDLTQPTEQAKALTRPQKARLAEQFRYTAAGLRATKALR